MNAGTTRTRTGIKTIKTFPGAYHDRLNIDEQDAPLSSA
jgi:hypothetical protein